MFNIQEEIKRLPDNPGVYIMKDVLGQIIYVGKAVVLKNRVRQYFQASAKHPPKVAAMVSKITEFEYIITDSELEALILECNLIKKHRPKFNILLKDDKHYPYIKVTMNENFPRVIITRKQEKDGAKYFGPYSNSFAVKDTLDTIKKIFPIKTCNKAISNGVINGRPCLNYHIHQCLGPCMGVVHMDEYREMMKDICNFLSGKQDDIISKLQEQMHHAAEIMDFERAAQIRDKINNIKHIGERQKIISTALEDQDVIAFAQNPTDSCIQVFFVRGGKLIGREHFIFEGVGEVDNNELMTSFIKQFYSSSAYVPGVILLPEDIDEIKIIESWLSNKRAAKVHIKVPRRGEKHELIEMVSQNALTALEQFKDRVQRDELKSNMGLKGIAGLLEIDEIPQRMEAYDISNTGSSELVASMIVFTSGKADNGQYRRFKIKSVDTQNDYASMQEVIFRRFKHAVKEREEIMKASEGETGTAVSIDQSKNLGSFTIMPNLLLIDGGLGHVNAVLEVMNELKINIPVAGMVKDDRHRTRGLIYMGKEYDLRTNLPLLRFVTSIQDEAHRFALEYNKSLRKKRYIKSELDEIEGIGPSRKKALLKHFGSIKAIRQASAEEITQVEGISLNQAEKIKGALG